MPLGKLPGFGNLNDGAADGKICLSDLIPCKWELGFTHTAVP